MRVNGWNNRFIRRSPVSAAVGEYREGAVLIRHTPKRSARVRMVGDRALDRVRTVSVSLENDYPPGAQTASFNRGGDASVFSLSGYGRGVHLT